MSSEQQRLIDVPAGDGAPAPTPAGAESAGGAAAKARGAKAERSDAPRRTSSKAIGPGDIVEIDKKGRRFHALVRELEQLESGRFELSVRPLDSRISYHRATVREVVAVWRRARGRG